MTQPCIMNEAYLKGHPYMEKIYDKIIRHMPLHTDHEPQSKHNEQESPFLPTTSSKFV